MTNEEKANEIARDMLPYNNAEYHACYNSAIKAMEWKDEEHAQEKQQCIKKVTDFISQYFYISTSNHVISKKDYYSLIELIRDINQAMEE